MMMTPIFYLALLAVPAAVLLWRVVVSKQKTRVRIGAAVCAMLTLVGAVVMPRFAFGESDTSHLETIRDGLAVLAAASGPLYLLFWSRKHRGRGRSRTISIIAAIIGLVPIVATLATALIFAGDH
jgi:peptidoglycan/LPS O-acetylase OafA/YrhL